MIWTDAHGLAWEIVDWEWKDFNKSKRRVTLGTFNADGRAFVPHHREGDVRIYYVHTFWYHDTSDRVLQEQLRLSRPASMTVAQAFWHRNDVHS